MACTWGSKVNGILTVFAIGFAVLIDLWDILDVHKEGHTMVKFNLLFGYFLSHSFIVRITFGGTLLRGPLDLLQFPFLFTFPSSMSISPSFPSLAPVTIS